MPPRSNAVGGVVALAHAVAAGQRVEHLLEFGRVRLGQVRRDDGDGVLGVVGGRGVRPVQAAGPHGRPVDDGELVVRQRAGAAHVVEHRDAGGRQGLVERLVHGRLVGLVIAHDPHPHAPVVRVDQGVAQVGPAEVVDRRVDGRGRAVQQRLQGRVGGADGLRRAGGVDGVGEVARAGVRLQGQPLVHLVVAVLVDQVEDLGRARMDAGIPVVAVERLRGLARVGREEVGVGVGVDQAVLRRAVDRPVRPGGGVGARQGDVHALHGVEGRVAGIPGVHPVDGGHAVAEGQVFVVGFVLQRAGVDLVGRGRRRAAVVGALQEVVAVGRDAAAQGDVGGAVGGGQGPARQVDGAGGGVAQLDPLVAGRLRREARPRGECQRRCAGPGDLRQHHVADGGGLAHPHAQVSGLALAGRQRHGERVGGGRHRAGRQVGIRQVQQHQVVGGRGQRLEQVVADDVGDGRADQGVEAGFVDADDARVLVEGDREVALPAVTLRALGAAVAVLVVEGRAADQGGDAGREQTGLGVKLGLGRRIQAFRSATAACAAARSAAPVSRRIAWR